MSKRDVENYYRDVTKQFLTMQKMLSDYAGQADKTMIDPNIEQNLKTMLAPLSNNYQTLSYIMYLLNKPVRSKKVKTYDKTYGKKFSSVSGNRTKEDILKENEKVVDDLAKMLYNKK